MSDEPLVVPLHVPVRGKLFLPLSVVLAIAFAGWIAATPSWQSILFGGGGLLALILVWGGLRDMRRIRAGAPAQIVATDEGITSTMWSISWDRVARMWVGRSAGKVRVLNIAPYDLHDIRRPRSFFYSANLYLGRLLGIPAIQIPEMNIDRPVETLLAQLEKKAGRKFNGAGGEAVSPE